MNTKVMIIGVALIQTAVGFSEDCKRPNNAAPCGSEKTHDCRADESQIEFDVPDWPHIPDWVEAKLQAAVNAALAGVIGKKCGVSESTEIPLMGMHMNCECIDTENTNDKCKTEPRQNDCYTKYTYDCETYQHHYLNVGVEYPPVAVGVTIPVDDCRETPDEGVREGDYIVCLEE